MASNDDSLKNTEWKPGVSGNSVSREGSAVTKTYNTGLVNYYREHDLLLRLQSLPVPRVLPGSRPGELKLGLIDGIAGSQVVEQGDIRSLLLEMGKFLRRLQALDPETVADILPGEGPVIVHGDFAFYNCVMNQTESSLAAVLDWETAHLGEGVEDLAWCEWQFRNRFPQHAWAVSSLFEGFGAEPAWELREQAIAERLKHLNAAASSGEGVAVGRGGAEHYSVIRFDQPGEMAAFVAALSRFLNAPQGDDYRGGTTAVKVWQHFPADGDPELHLNDAALNATAAAFGHARVSGANAGKADEAHGRPIWSGDSIPSWSMEDAERALVVAPG